MESIVPESAGSRPAPRGGALHRPRVTDALTRALMEEWARVGYAALSLETVARRAGVGKAALYRRWPSKLAMVSDNFAALARAAVPRVDKGSLEADLRTVLHDLRTLLRHRVVRRILPDLHAEMPRSPELARLIRAEVQAPREALFADLIGRAIIRRELAPDCDLAFATDLVGAMIYWRLIVLGGRADDSYLDRLAASTVAVLKAPGTVR